MSVFLSLRNNFFRYGVIIEGVDDTEVKEGCSRVLSIAAVSLGDVLSVRASYGLPASALSLENGLSSLFHM